MENINELLVDLSAKTKELISCGGPEENGELFDEVISIQYLILKKFGLPPMEKYSSYFWGLADVEINEDIISETIDDLKKIAADYLFSPTYTPLKTLSRAVKEVRSYGDVLPELGFPLHEYLIFIYENFLLIGNANPKSVLDEFNVVKEHNLYELVSKLGSSGLINTKDIYEGLENKNLKYLEAFMLYKLYKERGFIQSFGELYTNDNNIEYYIFQAAIIFKYYLNLIDSGVDETQARIDTGFDNHTFFKIALLADEMLFSRKDIYYKEMKEYVFLKIQFELSQKEFEDIEKGFRLKWHASSRELVGDADMKNAVYRYLELIKHLISQDKVDTIVDLIIEYMESIGQWGK